MGGRHTLIGLGVESTAVARSMITYHLPNYLNSFCCSFNNHLIFSVQSNAFDLGKDFMSTSFKGFIAHFPIYCW